MGKENLHFGQVQVTHGARARARAKMLNNSYRVGNLKKKESYWDKGPWDQLGNDICLGGGGREKKTSSR